jgi:hypothetical protein
MEQRIKQIITFLVLPAVIILLVYLNFETVANPVRFDEDRLAREAVAIQRLKDIRTLQEAHKEEVGYYSPTMDSLKIFYNEGMMTSVIQIGSPDDSIAVVNTQKFIEKKRWTNLKDEEKQQRLYQAHLEDSTLMIVCAVPRKTPVKEVIFKDRKNFCVDSLAYIPFSGKDTVIMKTTLSETQGVKLPLFEARMPYKSLLRGLDEQLVVNKIAERKDLELYAGLKVGDVEKANNNAGNWE